MIAKNVSKQKIHIIVSSGSFVVPVNETVALTEDEFKMLSSFFKLERVEEPKKEEVKKAEPVEEPAPVEKPKKKAKK